jgi:prepilin-type N-terminal cleavage/methylation domain-containing protein
MQRIGGKALLRRHSGRARRERGFSLIEILTVVAIFMIMGGVTFISLQPVLKDARVATAYDDVLMMLRTSRQRAITERKQYIVCFGVDTPAGALTPLGAPTAQSIQVFRWDAGTDLSAAVQVTAIQLPTDIQFQTLSGLPNSSTTVPDGFGSGNTALDLDQGVAGGIRDQLMFMPDGSAVDTNGNANNGIVYLARTGDLYSSRAVTVYAATGRIRGWRLLNTNGSPNWTEQ